MDNTPDLSKMKPWDRMLWQWTRVNKNPVTLARQAKRVRKHKLERQNQLNGRKNNKG